MHDSLPICVIGPTEIVYALSRIADSGAFIDAGSGKAQSDVTLVICAEVVVV
jgi:hypothetical protein